MAIPIVDILNNLSQTFVNAVPGMVYALIALIVGYILGNIVHAVVKRALDELKVDAHLRKERLNYQLSSVFSLIAKWIVYFVFIQEAANQLGVLAISNLLAMIIEFIPNVAGAAILVIVAHILGLYIKDDIIGEKDLYSSLVGKMVFFLVMYVGIAQALWLVGVNTTLMSNILLIMVGSIGVAAAIALGFGLKDVVYELSEDYTKQFKKAKR